MSADLPTGLDLLPIAHELGSDAKIVSELRKHLSPRILGPDPAGAEQAGTGRYRGSEYVSDLRIYHEVELWGFEPQTSCMPWNAGPFT
jgi:hypothetical protein